MIEGTRAPLHPFFTGAGASVTGALVVVSGAVASVVVTGAGSSVVVITGVLSIGLVSV